MTVSVGGSARVELARATGRRLRVEVTVDSGDARLVGLAMRVPREVAWSRSSLDVARADAEAAALDALDALDPPLDAEADAAAREAARDGQWSELPEEVTAALGGTCSCTVTEGEGAVVVEAGAGGGGSASVVVLVVEAVSGAGGAELTLGACEAS